MRLLQDEAGQVVPVHVGVLLRLAQHLLLHPVELGVSLRVGFLKKKTKQQSKKKKDCIAYVVQRIGCTSTTKPEERGQALILFRPIPCASEPKKKAASPN